MPKALTIFLICLLPTVHAPGQATGIRYPYLHFTTNNGLPKMQVICLFQDRDGYIWAGTKGGVARYDGVTFKNYEAVNGNIGGVNNIFQAVDDDIILLTNKGVRIIRNDTVSELYSDNRFNFYFSNGWLNDGKLYIRTVYGKHDTPQDGLSVLACFYLDTKRFGLVMEIPFAINEIFPFSKDEALLFSTDGDGERQYYQVLLKGKVSRKYDLPFQLLFPSKRTHYKNTAIADKKGNVYTVARSGDSVKFTRRLRLPTMPGDNFLFYSPEDNSVYIKDHTNRLLRCSAQTTDTLVRANIAWMQMEDRDGNIWLASEDGIHHFLGFMFREYCWNLNPGKPDYIWSMIQSADSVYWLNSGTEGLWKYDASRQEKKLVYLRKDKITAATTQLYYHPVMQHDTIYFPGGDEIMSITRGKITRYRTNDAKLFLYKDPFTGKILAAGKSLSYIESDSVRTYIGEERLGLNSAYVLSVCRDKYNRLWYVSSVGVGCISPAGNVTVLDTKAIGDFVSVMRDSRDNLWFAGSHGIWHYDYVKIKKLRHPALRQVGALHEYRNKYLIASAVGQLAVVNLDSFYRHREIVHLYSHHNGYSGEDMSQNSIFEDMQGYVWVNASNTVIKFHPDSLRPNSISLPIINKVEISSDNIKWTVVGENHSSTYPGNNLLFHYSTVAYNHSGTVYYRTRLTGFSDWTFPTTETNAKFTNLPIRKEYAFEVMASLDGIHWTKPVSTTGYYIKPAFHQTYFFYLFVASVLTGTGIAVARRILHDRKKRLAREKELVRLRLQSIRKSILPHLALNALTGIIRLIKTQRYNAAIRYIYLLSPLIRQIWLLSEEGHHSLKNELAFIKRFLKLQQLLYKDKFSYALSVGPDIDKSKQVPILVSLTFVENALKHGLINKKGAGSLTLSVQHTGVATLLSVTDNGIGRRHAVQFNKNSTKQGLQILSELIEKMNRDNKQKMSMYITDVYDEAGNSAGTVASITIPDNYKY